MTRTERPSQAKLRLPPATLRHKLLNRFPKPKENLYHPVDSIATVADRIQTHLKRSVPISPLRVRRSGTEHAPNPTATTFPYTGFRQTCVKGETEQRGEEVDGSEAEFPMLVVPSLACVYLACSKYNRIRILPLFSYCRFDLIRIRIAFFLH